VAAAPLASRKVLLLGQSEPLIALGPGSLLDALIRACGAENVAADLGRASAPFPMELVRVRAPDWILLTGEPFPDSLRRAWADVPAVREGRIADARADDLVRAGPRTPDALERLGRVLRGEWPPERLSEER
jgi:ABC-type Fe3+-hydroxamate transport system substrate-binding protein